MVQLYWQGKLYFFMNWTCLTRHYKSDSNRVNRLNLGWMSEWANENEVNPGSTKDAVMVQYVDLSDPPMSDQGQIHWNFGSSPAKWIGTHSLMITALICLNHQHYQSLNNTAIFWPFLGQCSSYKTNEQMTLLWHIKRVSPRRTVHSRYNKITMLWRAK